MANGILGSIANMGSDVGVTSNRLAKAASGVADFRQRVAELEDYEAEKPARQAEYKVRKQQADIQSNVMEDYGDKIEESQRLTIDNTIGKLEQENNLMELQGVEQVTAAIQGEDDWENVKDSLAPAKLREYGIDPNKSYEENLPALEYLTRRTQHSLKQRQDLEMQLLKNRGAATAAANRAGFTPGPLGEPPTAGGFGQVLASLESDPDFRSLASAWEKLNGGPAAGAAFQQAATMVNREAYSILQADEQRNRALSKQGLYTERMSQTEAFERAKTRVKTQLFDGIETGWFGDPSIKFLTPEEAEQKEMAWRRNNYSRFMSNPKFQALEQEEQEQILHDVYMKQQSADYIEAQRRLGGRANAR